MRRIARHAVGLWISVMVFSLGAGTVLAQTPPAQAPAAPAPAAKPDDTPSIRIGATLFADYTYTQSPEATDADGNTYHPSQFNVGRSYINITGNISHLVAFRLTPDIARETGTGSSLSTAASSSASSTHSRSSIWTTGCSAAPGSRFGIQQTPWVDFQEGIYRYRFQGTMFSEREGYLSSSDAGASFHYNLPSNYGDVHVGVYNGENYNRAEANDQKALAGARHACGPSRRPGAVLRGPARARLL